MRYYDLHVSAGKDDLKEIIKLAEKLGWSGIGFVTKWTNKKSLEKTEAHLIPFLSERKGLRFTPKETSYISKIESKIKTGLHDIDLKKDFDVALGVEIQTNKPHMVSKIAKSIRKDVELIFVAGGDLEVNAAAVKTPEVDALLRPWFGRKDPGFNYILAKEASENNVALAFDFNELICTHKKTRTRLLSKMLDCARLARKYKAPFIISSGAKELSDLRSAFDLLSFGKVLGFQDPQIKSALSDAIIRENRKRLGGKWVMPGVELVGR